MEPGFERSWSSTKGRTGTRLFSVRRVLPVVRGALSSLEWAGATPPYAEAWRPFRSCGRAVRTTYDLSHAMGKADVEPFLFFFSSVLRNFLKRLTDPSVEREGESSGFVAATPLLS